MKDSRPYNHDILCLVDFWEASRCCMYRISIFKVV